MNFECDRETLEAWTLKDIKGSSKDTMENLRGVKWHWKGSRGV